MQRVEALARQVAVVPWDDIVDEVCPGRNLPCVLLTKAVRSAGAMFVGTGARKNERRDGGAHGRRSLGKEAVAEHHYGAPGLCKDAVSDPRRHAWAGSADVTRVPVHSATALRENLESSCWQEGKQEFISDWTARICDGVPRP
jgi:hypothetical protein